MVFTNDDLIEDEVKPGNIEDRPLFRWQIYVKEELIKHKIEFAVVDFFAYPSILLTDELGIPNLINLPGPLSALEIF